jgi:GNAT superfamily N-acetyltransferase
VKTDAGSSRSGVGLTYRPARPDELAACEAIWRVSINDYIVPLGQFEIPAVANPAIRLFTHLQATDPERFLVATVPDGPGERAVAFASAVVRERLWYLSMLFVLPEAQGAGIGRDLLSRVWDVEGQGTQDGVVRATATDSAQPISNALYALHDMVPRMPLFSLTGLPQRPEAFGPLPSGIVPLAFDEIAAGSPDGQGHRLLVDAIDTLDRELLGVAHPMDHRFLRAESRRGWLYRGPDGSPVGYGYSSEAGRLGPVAARDEALLGPILGHLTSAVEPRGAFAVWVGGAAHRAIVPALRAGLRLDPFPVLVCWDRPFADFARYLPISPGLLLAVWSAAEGPVRSGTVVPFAGPPRGW